MLYDSRFRIAVLFSLGFSVRELVSVKKIEAALWQLIQPPHQAAETFLFGRIWRTNKLVGCFLLGKRYFPVRPTRGNFVWGMKTGQKRLKPLHT